MKRLETTTKNYNTGRTDLLVPGIGLVEVKTKQPQRTTTLGRGCQSPPCVRDTRKPGLDNLREVERIAKRILQDVKKGRISKRTAHGRFLLLYRLVSGKDRDFKGAKARRAMAIVKKYWRMLRGL